MIQIKHIMLYFGVFLLIPVLLYGQVDELHEETFKSPRTAVICSAIFPGIGQLYNGKWVKASVLGGLEVYTLYRTYSFHQDYQETADKNYQINRNKHSWYSAGIYLYAMLDAYVDAHLTRLPEGNLVYDPVNKGIFFAFVMEF